MKRRTTMAKKGDITFRDLPKREEEELRNLRADLADLEKRVKRGATTKEEKEKRDRIKMVVEYYHKTNPAGKPPVELVDPLFVAARDAFNQNTGLLGETVFNHVAGEIKIKDQKVAANFDDVVKVSLVIGLLAADEVSAPRVMKINPGTN